MEDGVAIAERLGNATDEALGALRRSVNGDETEGTLGRHGDDENCGENATSWGVLLVLLSRFGVATDSPHCGSAPPAYPATG